MNVFINAGWLQQQRSHVKVIPRSEENIDANNYAFPQFLLGRLLSAFPTFTYVINSCSSCVQLLSYLIQPSFNFRFFKLFICMIDIKPQTLGILWVFVPCFLLITLSLNAGWPCAYSHSPASASQMMESIMCRHTLYT